jgi:cadmium resistance protein CadD (predicted permease)
MSDVREIHKFYDDDRPDDVGYEERRVVRRPAWSPTQLVVLVVGVVMIVFGGVALARTGLHFTAVPFTRIKVAGLGFTSMSAAITLVAGMVVACSCVGPVAARTAAWIFGVVFVAFGLVVALAPTAFTNMWGFTAANGVAIVICGAVLTLAAALFPVLAGASTSYSRSRRHHPVPQ